MTVPDKLICAACDGCPTCAVSDCCVDCTYEPATERVDAVFICECEGHACGPGPDEIEEPEEDDSYVPGDYDPSDVEEGL